jgi:hypothetical protein
MPFKKKRIGQKAAPAGTLEEVGDEILQAGVNKDDLIQDPAPQVTE